MQLSEESIKEFQDIFGKEFGKKLSHQEAFEVAHNLLGFFETLYKIDRRIKQSDGEEKKTN